MDLRTVQAPLKERYRGDPESSRITLRAEGATAMGVPVERLGVTVEGDLDLQGTLGTRRDVPVGFEHIRVRFDVEAPEATDEQLSSLAEKTERYCVVLQTLGAPPPVRTEWQGAAR
jgi:uncharacterized OsmC-like protein